MPAPVRIGLAGYGLGGRYFHAPLIASTGNCEFLGVVTTSPERRRQVAEDFGRPAFASLEELARAGAEAVAISTPAATHVTLTQQALRLGLAVVCDKPFALDADADGLDDDVFIALAHESGVRSHLWASRRQGAPGPRIRAAGTEGAYVIQDVDGQEAQLRSGASPAAEI